MSKKLFSIILLLLLALSSLIYVVYFFRESAPQFPRTTKKTMPTITPTALLSFTPNALEVLSGNASTLDISINSNAPLKLIQLEIGYDPTAITYANIIPGNYFSDSEVILEKIDIKNGRLSYALKGNLVNPNARTVATLSFTPVTYGLVKNTKISFLPKTYVKNERDVVKSIELNPANIILKPLYIQPISTPSGALINP